MNFIKLLRILTIIIVGISVVFNILSGECELVMIESVICGIMIEHIEAK